MKEKSNTPLIDFILNNKPLNKFLEILQTGPFIWVWIKWFIFANIFTVFLITTTTPYSFITIQLCKAMLAINAYSTFISACMMYSLRKEKKIK